MTQRASEATVELSALGYAAHADDELLPSSKQQKLQQLQPLDAVAVLGEPSDAQALPLPPKLDRQRSALGDAPPPPGSVMYQLAASPRAELHDMAELRAAHELRKSRSDREAAGSDDDASTDSLRNFKRQTVSAAAAADAIASTSVVVAHAHHRPSVFTFQTSKHSATKTATAITVPISVHASMPENDDLHHDQDMESVIRDELRRLGQK